MRLTVPQRLIFLTLLLSLGIGLLFARAISIMRSDEWDHARRTNASLVHTLDHSLSTMLKSVDHSMVGVIEGMRVPEIMALPPEMRNRALFDHSLHARDLAAVLVLDAQGQVMLDSDFAQPRKGNFADRDYFRVFKDGKHQGLYVAAPVQGRLTGLYSLPLSRAFYHPDGRFAGVVTGAIRLDYFQEMFSSVKMPANSSLGLYRDDGTLIVRFPHVGDVVGRNIAQTPIWESLRSSPEGAAFVAHSPLDGVERLYVSQHLDGLPMIVSVARSVDDVLHEWRRNALILGGGALVLMLACVALALLFVRELQQRQQMTSRLQQAEHYLRTILDNLPSTISYWDKAQRNRFINKTSSDLYGRTPEQLQGLSAAELLGPHDYAVIEPYVKQALQGHPQVFERTVTDAHGEVRHTHISYTPDRESEGGPVRGIFVQMTDITDRKHMEDELFREKERMRLTLQSIGDAVVCTDAEGRITYLNPVAQRMTGWQPFDAAGRDVDEVAPLYLPNGAQTQPSPLRVALKTQNPCGPTRGVVLRHKDGQRFEVEESASPIIDRHRRLTGAVMVLHDVTETMAMADRMAHLAQYDALTDLPNRVLLQDRARHALAVARRQGQSLAVMYLDLDGFKQVNDTLGHDVGDQLLVQFAHRLVAAMRQSDTVCRQGGDEFVVLLPGLESLDQATVVARKVLAVVREPFLLQGQALHVGLSAGMALFPQHGSTYDELARHADAAMYAAKRAGRMQVRRYAGPDAEPDILAPVQAQVEPADALLK